MTARRRRRKPPSRSRAELDAVTIEQIEGLATTVHQTVTAHDRPTLVFPQRSLSFPQRPDSSACARVTAGFTNHSLK